MDEFDNIRQEELKQQLAELKALRERLSSVDEQEKEFIAPFPIKLLKEELNSIDIEIKEIEKNAKESAKKYEALERQLKKANDKRERSLDGATLLSDEEIKNIKYSNEQEKLKINELSVETKKHYDELQKLIRVLNKKKNDIAKRMERSEALGLTTKEYNLIYSTIKSRNILDTFYDKMGLDSIAAKKESRRTKEEKALLEEAKDKIIAEINDYRRFISGMNKIDKSSILNIIEHIYLIDTKVQKEKTPRTYKIEESNIDNIILNDQEAPHKIKDSSISVPTNVVEEEPKDMKDAKANEKVDIDSLKPAEEKVTLFKDLKTSDYYVRKYAVDRFKLASADTKSEVRIDGSVCYKISEHDVERIKENANNSSSSYIVNIKDVEIQKDYIPGTNVLKPRSRKDGENPEDYENYLTEYYKKYLPEIEDYVTVEDPKKEVITTPVTEPTIPVTEPQISVPDTEPTVPVTEPQISVPDTEPTVPVTEPQIPVPDTEPTVPVTEPQISVPDTEPTVSEPVLGARDGRTIDGFNPFQSIVPETEPQVIAPDTEPIVPDTELETTVSEPRIEPDELTSSESSKVTEAEINDIVASELSKIGATEKDITDIINAALNSTEPRDNSKSKEELSKILQEVDASNIQYDEDEELEATNIEASQKFQEELANGNVSYNVATSIPKFAKRTIDRLKGLFDPVYDYDEPEKHHRGK